jgi:tetratricopeptide (TPR) repeat protein
VIVTAPSLALLLSVTMTAQPGPARKAPDATTLLRQAIELHQAGDILGAIWAYENSLSLEPDNPAAHSNLGAALARLGRYEEALLHYQRALALQPGDVGFRVNLALAYYKSGRPADAVPHLEQALRADSTHQGARVVLGDCYLQSGRFQDVVDLLAPWQRELGNDRAFAYLLGSALLETNRPEQAQFVIDRIFASGESAEGHLLMATAHMRAGDNPAAVSELEKAARLNPTLPLVQSLLGRALLRTGDQAAALGAFRRELEINPNDFQANLELGDLKKREQAFDEAEPYVRRALRMRPHDAGARFSLAGLHVSRGEAEQARALLETIVADHPTFTEAYVLLATVYYRLQRREDGDRMRARVEALNAEAQARQPTAAAKPEGKP